MINLTNSCKGCIERYVGCHGKCEKYSEFKNKVKEINDSIKKENKVTNFKIEAEVNTLKKLKKKKG